MLLSELFKGQPDMEIKGLCIDSRKAQQGDMFFCLKGLEADGHRFAASAIEKGAVAVVHTDDLEEEDGVTYIKVSDTGAELNRVCNLFFGEPSHKMTVFGVTGTNGKTTTTSIISDVYEKIKGPCGYMGTIAVRFGKVNRIPSLTTPDALEIHGNLRDMAEAGMDAVSMEVSSHGLAMGRVDAVDFDVAIFTNLTYDHLDYHKTMENYFEAKQILFKNMKKDGIAVINADDISFDELRKVCACRYVSYGVNADCDYRAEDVKLAPAGTEFVLVHGGKKYPVKTNQAALYNIYNLLSAVAAMHELGISLEKIIPAVENIAQVDGRMERIDEGQDFNLIVDYAHTPDGFEKVFEYAKAITPEGKKIYAVFGCAGKRDKVKRKVLGQIADRYCDKIFVTEEDPRDETAEGIAEMIMEGITSGNGVVMTDRYEAIKAAIQTAKTGDCVLILGKGDEPYMYDKDGRRPWMGDHEAAKKAVKER